MCDNDTNVDYGNINTSYENSTIVVKLSRIVMIPINGTLNVEKQLTIVFNLGRHQTINRLDFKYCDMTNRNAIDGCVHYAKELVSKSTIELAELRQLNNKGKIRHNLLIEKYFANALENNLIKENNFAYNTTYIEVLVSNKEQEIFYIFIDSIKNCCRTLRRVK